MIADGRRRIHDHHRKPGARKLQRHLLGLKLRSLIRARHLLQIHLGVLIAGSVPVHSNTTHGAGVNHTLDTGVARGRQQVPRAFHVRAVKFRRIFGPQAIVRRDVIHHGATRHGALQRLWIAQVTHHHFPVQFPHSARISHQGPHFFPACKQSIGYVPPQETGRPCY